MATNHTHNRTESHILYLALGTNLGDKKQNLQHALEFINQCVGQVCRTSTFLETEPWGFDSPNSFLNAVCMVHTTLSPQDCLNQTQEIERKMGRTVKSTLGHYHDRTIDLDLLLYDDLTLNTPRLTLPHPLMMQREFVTIPLSEVMPQEEFKRLKSQLSDTKKL